MPLGFTLDHIGPMATTADGIARLLSAIAGTDPLDPRQRGAIPRDLVTDYMPAIPAALGMVHDTLEKSAPTGCVETPTANLPFVEY